jgi:SAM-dependent methyltransferase
VSLPSRFPERPAVTHWNHNEHYHGFLLRQLPTRFARALDVGCGTGTFACRLAERADAVDAIDVSPQMIAAARLRHSEVPNLRWLVGDVLTAPLVLGGYDAVTAIASLHHLPLETGLSRLAELVRPGGTLAVLGLAAPSAVDYVRGVAAVPADTAVGCWKALRGRGGRPDQQILIAGETVTMPVRNPENTLAQIASAARRLLPGARLRRHVFYRYSLVWRRPGEDRLRGALAG